MERAELKKWFFDNMFGQPPIGRPADMELKPNGTILFGGGKVKIHLTVLLPPNAPKNAKLPVILIGDYRTSQPAKIEQYERQRANDAVILSNGFAVVRWDMNEVAPDQWVINARARLPKDQQPPCPNGVMDLYGGAVPTGNSWGTICAWAWGHARVLDWIETCPRLDARRVAVAGQSRMGKTALCAAVLDERFKMAYSSCSGTGGAHPYRLWKKGVAPMKIITVQDFPRWMCLNMRKFHDDETHVPHDSDEWMSLIAPRYLYVSSGSLDAWAGPKGEEWATRKAAETWEEMGLKGMDGHVGYHCHKGPHMMGPEDFKLFCKFCKGRL